MAKGRNKKNRYIQEDDFETIDSMNKEKKGDNLSTININFKCRTKKQKEFVESIRNKEITIVTGPAGSGKTFLACAECLSLLKNNPDKFKKIVIIKSVTTLADESLGFLKGSLDEKLAPIMYSFMHNFEKLIGHYHTENLKQFKIIEELPIAYMRGITLDESLIIVDEVQNISVDNIRTIMTRIGSSKMIFLGDTEQIDIKNKNLSSLNFIVEKFKGMDEIGIVEFTEEDIVRNPIIKKLEKIFRENK